MRKAWMGAAGAVAVLVAVTAATLLHTRQAEAEQARKKAALAKLVLEFTPSEVTHPLPATLAQTLEFSGPLMAPRTAVVRAKAAGTLLTLNVAEGNRVRAGQLLGSIDLADLNSRVAERSAQVEAAGARLIEAERAHRANEDLARQQFISGNALASSRATLDAAGAQHRAAQAQMSAAQIGVREAALLAPIDGVVGKRNVLPGEKVAAEQELLSVVDLRQLELAGTVGTHQVASLRPGQAVQVRVEGQAEPAAGRIDRIAPTAEPGIRGVRVVVALGNPEERWRAGQFASAEVRAPGAAERLTIPATALASSGGQEQVWVIEGGVLVRRNVLLGSADAASGRVEVLDGVTAETTLLAARFDHLREGAKAAVVAQRGGAAGGAAAAAR